MYDVMLFFYFKNMKKNIFYCILGLGGSGNNTHAL